MNRTILPSAPAWRLGLAVLILYQDYSPVQQPPHQVPSQQAQPWE